MYYCPLENIYGVPAALVMQCLNGEKARRVNDRRGLCFHLPHLPRRLEVVYNESIGLLRLKTISVRQN